MTLQMPRTQSQCRKKYEQLLKRTEGEGTACQLAHALSGETDWCKMLLQLAEDLDIEVEHVGRESGA